jgi:CubicO group peptidase (beta-lactamase class C family)
MKPSRLPGAALACLALACATPEPSQGPTGQALDRAVETPVPTRFEPALAYSNHHGGGVLLVIESGETVVESGPAGADPREPHPLHGASDAFWGVVAVAAEEDGILDLDELVTATLPEFVGPRERGEITLRQLLSFTSGLESGAGPVRGGAQDLLKLEMVTTPGERFQYGPSHLRVFAAVLSGKLADAGEDPDPVRYLEARILDPIGAPIAGWTRDASGVADPGDGASMLASDWGRFGSLLLRHGRFEGREVVSPRGMEAVFQGSEANPTFGLGVWLNRASKRRIGARWGGRAPAPAFYPDGLSDLVVASGAGNQRLYVIPSLDTVVVRFGVPDHSFRDAELLARLVTALKG